jgi:hypothetical protein
VISLPTCGLLTPPEVRRKQKILKAKNIRKYAKTKRRNQEIGDGTEKNKQRS